MSDMSGFIESVKRSFTDVTATGVPFVPLVMGIRDGHAVISALVPVLEVVRIAKLMAAELRADEMLLVTDNYLSGGLLNPVTGKEWEPGEMSEVAQNHDGVAKGWVTEALTIHRCERFGVHEMVSLAYTRDPLTWGEVTQGDSGQPEALMEGTFTDLFTPFPNQPVLPRTVGKNATVPQEAIDGLLATLLTAMGLVVGYGRDQTIMLIPDGSDRIVVIRQEDES